VLDPYGEDLSERESWDGGESLAGAFGVFGVVVGVGFGSFDGVVGGVMKMANGDLGVVRGAMMVAFFVMTRGFAMVAGGVVVVFGCFVVMFGCLLGHFCSPCWMCGREA
jgi:hypothetical protein